MCQYLISFKFNRNGEFISYAERTDAITKRLELCGYFCLITSEEMTASEALIHYKGRDVSEKLFSSDKSFIGAKSMRVQSNEALSAKIFIEFIALIARNRMHNLLKDTLLKMETRQNYLTVPASIRELEKIDMVRRSNGQYRLDHAVSKRQRIILSHYKRPPKITLGFRSANALYFTYASPIMGTMIEC